MAGAWRRWAAAVGLLALGAPDAYADGARHRSDLAAAARCVSDYLEAVAAAAPPRARPGRGKRAPEGAGRWERARALLAPAVLATSSEGGPLAPWASFAQGGAFLGYELLASRRAPRGGAVVVARERVVASYDQDATERRCAYLVGPVSGTWRIVDARCGRDYADGEVVARWAGAWDDPAGARAEAARGPPARLHDR